MEAEWERGRPFVSLTLEEARRLLSPQRISVRSLTLLAEGKANTNYLMETRDGPRVLRLHQRQGGKLDLSHLAPLGVRVPELFSSSATWSVYEWIPGVSLEQALIRGCDLPYTKVARQLAQTRLAMNGRLCACAGFFDADEPGAAFDFSGQHDHPLVVKDAWPSAIEGLLGWLRHILPSVNLPKGAKSMVARTADDAEPRLQAIAGPPVLVHGDFKASNLLVDEAGLTGVLDWEFAHAGTWLTDVGQLFRHPEALPDGFAEAFLDEMKVGKDALLLARTLDLVNLVDFLRGGDEGPKMRAQVETKIQGVCAAYAARFG